MPGIISPARVLAVGLALGIAVDLLFYGKGLGISVPLFVLLLMAALFALGGLEGAKPAWRNLWLLAPIIFFAVMVAVRANIFVTFLNISLSFVLLCMLVYFYSAGRVEKLGVFGYVLVSVLAAANAVSRPVPLVRSGANFGALRKQGLPRLLPYLRGLVIAFPVLLLFACLLASADTIFAGLLSDAFKLVFFFNIYDLLGHIMLASTAAWLLAGGLAYALSRRTEADADKEPDNLGLPFHIGFIEAATVLALVDLLFLVFAWIQFSYLFGMQEWAARGAWDYRDYARRGFAELTLVSILSLGLIMSLHHLAWRETGRQTGVFKALSTLMVGLVLVFLASAWQRMFYWEQVDAYMFTQTRIYVRVFIAWLGLTMGWLLVTLWALPRRFAIGAFGAVLGFVITLNAVNSDANVAQYNLEQYARTGVIDDNYLDVLSEDAVPAIVQAYETVPPNRKELLRWHLRGRLQKMEKNEWWREWQAFHLSRSEAYKLLDARRDQLR